MIGTDFSAIFILVLFYFNKYHSHVNPVMTLISKKYNFKFGNMALNIHALAVKVIQIEVVTLTRLCVLD